jgi:hypothetical protein
VSARLARLERPPVALPVLRTGFPDLDALRLMRPGRLLLLESAPDAMLCRVVAQAAAARGALVVEAANRFDAYRLVEAGQRQGLQADRVLAGLRIARAFTPWQLQALLEEALPRDVGDAGLVLVSGACAQWLDPDTPRRAGRVLQRRALRVLRELAPDLDAPLLLAEDGARLRASPASREAILAEADEAASFSRGGGDAWRVRLRRAGAEILARPADAVQRSLAAWGA